VELHRSAQAKRLGRNERDCPGRWGVKRDLDRNALRIPSGIRSLATGHRQTVVRKCLGGLRIEVGTERDGDLSNALSSVRTEADLDDDGGGLRGIRFPDDQLCRAEGAENGPNLSGPDRHESLHTHSSLGGHLFSIRCLPLLCVYNQRSDSIPLRILTEVRDLGCCLLVSFPSSVATRSTLSACNVVKDFGVLASGKILLESIRIT
jgi:hypothetical protein